MHNMFGYHNGIRAPFKELQNIHAIRLFLYQQINSEPFILNLIARNTSNIHSKSHQYNKRAVEALVSPSVQPNFYQFVENKMYRKNIKPANNPSSINDERTQLEVDKVTVLQYLLILFHPYAFESKRVLPGLRDASFLSSLVKNIEMLYYLLTRLSSHCFARVVYDVFDKMSQSKTRGENWTGREKNNGGSVVGSTTQLIYRGIIDMNKIARLMNKFLISRKRTFSDQKRWAIGIFYYYCTILVEIFVLGDTIMIALTTSISLRSISIDL